MPSQSGKPLIETLIRNLQVPQTSGSALRYLRLRSHPAELEQVFAKAQTSPEIHKAIYGQVTPLTFGDLGTNGVPSYGEPLERIVSWYSLGLTPYVSTLSTFCRLRERFESAFLLGQATIAKELLDEIESKFGFSVWLIENRLNLVQEFQGTDAQKKLCQTLLSQSSGYIDLFVYILSLRAERKLTVTTYRKKLNAEIAAFPESIQDHIRFHFDFPNLNPRRPYAFILAADWNLSLVDRYLSFLRISELLCAEGNTTSLPAIRKALLPLASITDPLISNLSLNCGIKSPVEKSALGPTIHTILDSYTVGNYRRTIESAVDLIKSGTVLPELIELIARSTARIGSNETYFAADSLVHRLIRFLGSIFRRDSSADANFIQLRKISHVHQSQKWATYLLPLTSAPFPSPPASTLLTLSYLNSHPLNPRAIKSVQAASVANYYFSELKRIFGDSTTLAFHSCTHHALPISVTKLHRCNLEPSRSTLYEARLHIKNGRFDLATPLLESLVSTTDPLLHQEAVLELLNCYWSTENTLKAVIAIVDAYSRNPAYLRLLSAPNLYAKVLEQPDLKRENEISIPIFVSLSSRTLGKDEDSKRAVFVERYLNIIGVDRPSQLFHRPLTVSIQKLILFLQEASTQNVLDTIPTFQTSEEVDRERIAIFQGLSTIDPDNTSTYSREIESISQKIILNKGLQEVDESKIFVDTDGIKRSIGTTIREKFERYIELPDTGPRETDSVQNVAIVLLGTSEVVTLPVRFSEKKLLLHEILNELRDRFVSSDDYGLDGHLSVNIRHGTLSNHIRYPLETADIIGIMDEYGVYQVRSHWLDSIEKPSDRDNARAALSVFSSAIDNLIGTLVSDWIQVSSSRAKKDSIFDFSGFNTNIAEYETRILSTMSSDDFVEMVFEDLWKITEDCLQAARFKILSHVKATLNEAFDHLLADINAIGESKSIAELVRAIVSSRTILLNQIDEIAGWFRRSQGSAIGPFFFRLPIDVCIERQRNLAPLKALAPKVIGDSQVYFLSKTFKSFVNIFTNLFENITKHSGIKGRNPEVSVEHSISKEGLVRVKVANEVAKERYNDCDIRTRLSELKQGIDYSLFAHRVKSEGETGFLKIKKILDKDLGCTSTIDFGFSPSTEEFIVEITFDGASLVE